MSRLKESSVRSILSSRYPAAMAAGCVLAMAFPKWEMAGAAWIAPGLLLLATAGRGSGPRFRAAYVAGATHYLISLSFLLRMPFLAGAIAGWIALSLYLALFPACWAWFCWRLFPAGPAGSVTLSERMDGCTWIERAVWGVACAAAWVAMEMAVSRLLTGFPWNFLAVSQYKMLPLIQLASITGVWGISFLIVWFSVALLCGGLQLIRHPLQNWRWMAELALPFLVAIGACLQGWQRIRTQPPPARTIKAALVQPSIPQTLIFDPKENTNRFNELVRLSTRALASKPDILIWPEAAVPNMLRYDADTATAIIRLTTGHHVWMILGADDAVSVAGNGPPYRYYNSSFVIDPKGDIRGTYRKRHLVIFGEYVPLVKWLPFLKHLTPIGDSTFSAGTGPSPFHLAELKVTASVLICFEDTFASMARESVDETTDFLLNLTNNGWFGESAAQWQHAANAMFRAIENGVPLVRCANNGLTCWVDPVGRMHDLYFPGSNDIYGPGFKLIEIPVLPEGGKRSMTYYHRHGDWFGWGCVLMTVLAAVPQFWTWWRSRSRRPEV